MEGLAVLAVVASLSAGGWLVFRRLRRPGAEPLPAPAPATPPTAAAAPVDSSLVCPSCRREYPAGLRFCLHDSRVLVPRDQAEATPAETLGCRTCKRSFEPGTRYCPFDAEELAPVRDVPRPRAAEPAADGAKICPQCATRFGSDERFCGRDGAELTALN